MFRDNKGMVEYMIALYIVSVLALLLCYQVRSSSLIRDMNVAQDNLDHACLAGLLVNRRSLGEKGVVAIDDYRAAYQAFRNALRNNMDEIDEVSSYEVQEWILYNPIPGGVTITTCWGSGNVSNRFQASNAAVKTPDGKTVENPTIYAKVKLMVPIHGEMEKKITIDATVDVKA